MRASLIVFFFITAAIFSIGPTQVYGESPADAGLDVEDAYAEPYELEPAVGIAEFWPTDVEQLPEHDHAEAYWSDPATGAGVGLLKHLCKWCGTWKKSETETQG